MATLDPTKSKSTMKWKSSSPIEISQPSLERSVRATSNHDNSTEGYQHLMSFLHSLTEQVSQLTSSVQPIVAAWNDHNPTNSNQVRGFIDELCLVHNTISFSLLKVTFYQDFIIFNYMQNNFIKATKNQNHLDVNKSHANIDSDHELMDKNVQPNNSYDEVI